MKKNDRIRQFHTFIPPVPPSIEDVARHAGVSTATVSRVLNGVALVRAETKSKVELSIAALGYRISETARSLATSASRQILVLVPDFSNPYYGEIVRGIESVAREHGYHVLLSDTHADNARERTYVQLLGLQMADGVVCLDPVTIRRLVSEGIDSFPWVACSEFLPEADIPYVSIDHRQAAKDAVLYLLSRGHKNIGFVNSDERFLYAQQRREGYEDALREAGLEVRGDYIQAVGGIDYPLGELAARRFLALNERPTAIFAVSDTLAIGVMKAAFRAGLRIPEDLAVVGFDDVPVAEMFEPSITTIAQPMYALGQRAFSLLLQRIKGENPQSEVLPHRMVLRQSA